MAYFRQKSDVDMWHILGKNHRWTTIGTYIHLKMNFFFDSIFNVKFNQILISNMVVKYSLLSSFTTTMDRNHFELLILYR